MGGRIETHVEDGIGTLVFDHEARRNALTHAMWVEIPKVVRAFEDDPAGGGLLQTQRTAPQGGFSATGFTHQAAGGAAHHRQVHAIDSPDIGSFAAQ